MLLVLGLARAGGWRLPLLLVLVLDDASDGEFGNGGGDMKMSVRRGRTGTLLMAHKRRTCTHHL